MHAPRPQTHFWVRFCTLSTGATPWGGGKFGTKKRLRRRPLHPSSLFVCCLPFVDLVRTSFLNRRNRSLKYFDVTPNGDYPTTLPS